MPSLEGGQGGDGGQPRPLDWLSHEQAQLLRSGVGVTVASRDLRQLASLVRGVGFRIEAHGELTVFVSATDGEQLLHDARASGQVAVVFSQPSTHRTVQFKGALRSIETARPEDFVSVDACCEAMARDLEGIGFERQFADGLHAFDPAALRALRFRPEAAFDQTPGPRAGAAISLGGGAPQQATAASAAAARASSAVAFAEVDRGSSAVAASPAHGEGHSASNSEPRPDARSAPAMAGETTTPVGPRPQLPLHPAPLAPIPLEALRPCLEGATPGIIATCATDGMPNVSYLSQVQYVDPRHIALSFQFFNKTRANVLANPRARLLVIHPRSGSLYQLTVRYLHTQTEGPLFESMRAKIAGIASHTGMTGVFRLLGADLYRVEEIARAHAAPQGSAPMATRPELLPALRATAQAIADCADLEALFGATLAALKTLFCIDQGLLMLVDAGGERLYTVASMGYPESGIGSELPLGAGVIGVAARERAPIRLSHLAAEYAYGRAIREAALRDGLDDRLETEIPFPGLADARSQLAVPIVAAGRALGVIFVESREDLRFTYDDEDALSCLAALVGQAMQALQWRPHAHEADPPATPAPAASTRRDGPPVIVRHYAADDSVFLDASYLIKGVAGAVFWALVRDHVDTGRTAFTNRELRLDPRIRLPEIGDNLEARLVLLARRLAERDACVRIEKTGRGRFCLSVTRPLQLVNVEAP